MPSNAPVFRNLAPFISLFFKSDSDFSYTVYILQISSTLLKGEGTYISFQISSTLIKGDGISSGGSNGGNNEVSSECVEMGPGLICVARRIPNTEKLINTPVEQFTTKLEKSGKIMGIDTSGVSSTYSLYLNKVKIVCNCSV